MNQRAISPRNNGNEKFTSQRFLEGFITALQADASIQSIVDAFTNEIKYKLMVGKAGRECSLTLRNNQINNGISSPIAG